MIKGKEVFLSLFRSNKDKQLEEDNNKLLLPVLPFYGKAKSIHSVIETEECYYKVLYNYDGTVSPDMMRVPKGRNKRNFKLVLGEWYNDLNNWLEMFHSKYLECENSVINPKMTDKQFYLLATVTFLATVASIPFLFTTAIVGLIFGTISGFSLYMVLDIHKKDVQKIRDRDNFRKDYREYQRCLSLYRVDDPTDKEEYTETAYKGIVEKEQVDVKSFPKVKTLSREGVREAA